MSVIGQDEIRLRQNNTAEEALRLIPGASPSSNAQVNNANVGASFVNLRSLGTNRMLDGWIRINPAGTVTVFTGKCELGQGILTALAQIAAEELDVAYERVEMVSADTARTPNEGMTAGSLSVENSGTALRFACAEARQILFELAAAKLGVAVAKLSASDGTVTGSGKVTYWELAREANLEREASARARPKPPAQHRIVGRSIPRRDIPASS